MLSEKPDLCGQSLEKIASDRGIVRTNVIFRQYEPLHIVLISLPSWQFISFPPTY